MATQEPHSSGTEPPQEAPMPTDPQPPLVTPELPQPADPGPPPDAPELPEPDAPAEEPASDPAGGLAFRI